MTWSGAVFIVCFLSWDQREEREQKSSDPPNVEQIKSLHHFTKSTSIHFNLFIIVLLDFTIACSFKWQFPLNSKQNGFAWFLAWYLSRPQISISISHHSVPFFPQFHQSANAERSQPIKWNVQWVSYVNNSNPPECFSAETCLAHGASADPPLPQNDSPKMLGCEDAGQ